MLTKKHAVDDDFESPRNVVTESNVDYLSYKFDVMDLAASWRALTKQKLTVVNGLRLENASWRTWAKQKNNLRTISPDTLNWLKDSDVTWLYGPLHTVIKNMDEEDRYAKPKIASTEETMGLMTSPKQKQHEDIPSTFNTASVLSPTAAVNTPPSSSLINNCSSSSISNPNVSPQKPLKSALKKVTMSDLLKRSASELQLNTINTNGDSISKANQQLGEFSPAVIASHRQPKLRFNQYVEQCVALPHVVDEKRRSRLKFSDLNNDILENEEEDTTTTDEDYDPDEDSEPESVIFMRRPSKVRSIKKIEPTLLKASSKSDYDSMDSSDEDDGLNIPSPSFNRRRSSTFQPRRKSSSTPITVEDWEAESAESDALVKHIIRASKGKEPLGHKDPAADKMPTTAVNYPEDSDINNVNQGKSDYEYHFDDDDWDTHSEHVEDDPFSFTSHQEYSPVAPSAPVGCQIYKAPVSNEPVLPAVNPKVERSSSEIRASENMQKRYQSDQSSTNDSNTSDSSFFSSIAYWASSHLWPTNHNNTK